jgi:DNA-binding GntR family transcriptional regulator
MSKIIDKKIERIATKGSLSEKVYKEIKRAILEGAFAPGDLLPEDFLTNATGASRTPVREALMHLQADGLVRIVPRKGARVLEMDLEELAELVEARELLETAYFDRAIRKIPREKIQGMRDKMAKLAAEMASIDDPQLWTRKRGEYSQLDFDFHRSLVAAENNRFILDFYDTLLDRIKLYSHHSVIKHPVYFYKSTEEHEEIFQTILAGDMEKSENLLRHHVRQSVHRFVAIKASLESV